MSEPLKCCQKICNVPLTDEIKLTMSDDEEEEAQYNNTNRAFLQAFQARSTLTYQEAKPILAAIFTAHGKTPFPL